MLDNKSKREIINNIVKDIKKNYAIIDNFELYTAKKIEEEKNKIQSKSKRVQKVIVYDKKFDPQKDCSINIIFEDFIGKNKRLNIFNSCEQINIEEKNDKNMDYFYDMFCKKAIFNLNCFVSNLFNFNRKRFVSFFIFFINYLLLFLINFSLTTIFFILNTMNCAVFKIFKFFLHIKYKIFRKYSIKFFNIILILPLFLLKEILIFLKEIGNLLGDIFIKINYIINFITKEVKNNVYTKITTNMINRNRRSREHKNILNKINEKAKNIFMKYNMNNKKYLEHFDFAKVSYTPFTPEHIENNIIKEYCETLEQVEVQQLINKIKKTIGDKIKEKIYKKEINTKIKSLNKKKRKIFQYEKNINKYLKKKFKDNILIHDMFKENLEKGL